MPKFNIGIMLDNETFSTKENGVVIEMAMVAFDLSTGRQIDDEFDSELKYCLPTVPQQELGREADIATFSWWLKQAQSAQKRLNIISGTMMELKKLLVGINQYAKYRRGRAVNSGGRFEIWSRGPMDIGQLESLFRQFNIEPSWKYNDWRDLRTLMSVSQVNIDAIQPPQGHIQHDSLSDCHFQVKCYRVAMENLGEI